MGTSTAATLMAGRLRILLATCVVLTVGLGIAKTFHLREHPPKYALKEGNSYQGFVSGDNFSHRAALFRSWMVGEDEGARELGEFLRGDLHPTSLTVPAMVGALAITTQSIPLTFMALSALAVMAQTALVVHLGRRNALDSGGSPEDSSAAAWIVGILFASNLLTGRTSAQLILDPFCSVLSLGCLALALRWTRDPSIPVGLGLVSVQILGLFTKVSYLPLLAVPGVVVLAQGRGLSRALRAGALFGLLPLVPVAAYLEWIPGAPSAGRDFEHFLNAWRLSPDELKHFATEMLLLLQFWPLLIVASWRRGGAMARATLVSAGLVFLSTCAFRLPAVPRLYLPFLALVAAGSSPAILSTARSGLIVPFVMVLVLANYVLMIVGTFL